MSIKTGCGLMLLAALAVLAGPATSHARMSSTCLGPDSLSDILVHDAQYYAAATNAVVQATRDSLGIPATISDFELVARESVCSKAQAAYAAHVPSHPERLSGSVYVVRVGTTYSVWDPAWYLVPETATIMQFDSHWNLLSVRH